MLRLSAMSLKEYHRKRRFDQTREPKGKRTAHRKKKELIFVVQEHRARKLHWDFRLEADGVLKSWAVTREPSLDTKVRRLAIQTEDHPYEYAKFSGKIPRGEYGAGGVKIWDHGTYTSEHPVIESMEHGLVEVILRGKKLRGRFVLVRTRSITGAEKDQWLFFKARPKIVAMEPARARGSEFRSRDCTRSGSEFHFPNLRGCK